MKNKFTPDETVYRFLFTSPAWFVGETHQTGFSLTVVFPSPDNYGSSFDFRGPYGRSKFMFSFNVPLQPKDQIVIQTYSWIGEEVSALIGGFFGKLVVNLGHMQTGERLTIPRSWDDRCDSHEKAAFNGKGRKPDGPSLDLSEAAALVKAYMKINADIEGPARVLRAAEFYRMALENYANRPEISFTLFISSLEALLELRDYQESELYDEDLVGDLDNIRFNCHEGEAVVRRIKSRFFQIKKKVALLVNSFVPDSFFSQREISGEYGAIHNREELRMRIRAAYDLRSRLLHTGNFAGTTHIAMDQQGSEYVLGIPVLSDKKVVKLVSESLNLTGLERVTSTVLRTAIKNVFKL